MTYTIKITTDKVREVKGKLKLFGIRETARQSNISYYTAWCIKEGKYDNEKPLQERQVNCFSRCPITGF